MNAAALFVQPPHQNIHVGTSQISSAGFVPTGGNCNDHPKLSAIMSHLQYEFENYKYTVYRAAAKFVTLQKIFFTASIPYKLVLAMLERHGIREADTNLMVPPFQLTSLIHDIFFACEKLGHFTKAAAYQLESATAVLANFFWNIFDPHRRHSISLLEIKMTFIMLCKLYSTDQLVTEIYKLVCDNKTHYVTKFSFEYMLNIFTKMLTYLGEGGAYGAHNLPMVMEQCFERCHNTMGLTEYQFHCIWTTTQTRFLIYANLLALIKRIEDTEKLIHNNACAACHKEKIIGIRFKCQTCTNLSLCLKCFATGFATNKHEAGHRMYEVFTEDLPPKKISHYFAKLCSVFLFTPKNSSNSSSEETRGFCNSNETGVVNETELVTIETNRTSNASTISVDAAVAVANVALSKQKLQAGINKLEPSLAGLSTTASQASNASERLQSIIDRLLQQNTKLENQLKCIKSSSHDEIAEFLGTHQQFLVEIINEMRNFSQTSGTLSSYPTSSTPNRSIFAKNSTIKDSFNAAATTADENLTHSINGADINRSYLDANKSDYSINDLSLWFNQRRMTMPPRILHATKLPMSTHAEVVTSSNDDDEVVNMRDTEMTNFKLLLNKVKEIVEDSYSDNTELSEATQNLENVLDSIIKDEESRRSST